MPVKDTERVLFPNTPLGVDGEETSFAASSYFVDELILTTQNPRGTPIDYDIRRLLVSFTITEELFSPIIVFSGIIRDDVNFFETAGIRGQERLRATITKTEPGENGKTTKISLNLVVKSYPDYIKDTSSINVQEYSFIAVSDFAYLSALQKISRAHSGNPIDTIVKLFNEYLGVFNVDIDTRENFACMTPFDGIVTIQTPLRAIDWLRSKCADGKGSPFFIYSQISEEDKIFIRSYRSILADELYPSNDIAYEYRDFVEGIPSNEKSWSERSTRILSLTSNIKLDKLEQIKEGSFGSKIEVTDLRKKRWFQVFTNLDAIKRAEREGRATEIRNSNDEWAAAMRFFANTAKNRERSGFSNIIDPAEAAKIKVQTQGDERNSSAVVAEEGEKIRSYLSTLESMSHEIEIYGDLRMNPGKRIRINIPKSINAGDEIDDNPESDIDENLSGEYIVAAAVHTFTGGEYTTRLKIIRDDV